MTLVQITPISAAQQQLDAHNRASSRVKTITYHPPAGTAWTVAGLILDNSAVTGDETSLVNGMNGLAVVTIVANPRVWGQTADDILANPGGGEPDIYELVLSVETLLSGREGWGVKKNTFSYRKYRAIKPPLNKKWMMINVVLPAELTTAQSIEDLEMALGGVTKVTTAEHLLSGIVPTNASDVRLAITTRMKIEPIEA